MSELRYRTSDPDDPALVCFMVTEKLWPLCHCLQEVYTFFIIAKKHPNGAN